MPENPVPISAYLFEEAELIELITDIIIMERKGVPNVGGIPMGPYASAAWYLERFRKENRKN